MNLVCVRACSGVGGEGSVLMFRESRGVWGEVFVLHPIVTLLAVHNENSAVS